LTRCNATLSENVYSRFINAINKESDFKLERVRRPLIREMSLTKTNYLCKNPLMGKVFL